ncbi:MAG: hypothetical protein R3251_03410 [Candidatus Spechtbacterales bacterium]|nr:hypothetical protein [Candidatus Spechtbacterales bacterium]
MQKVRKNVANRIKKNDSIDVLQYVTIFVAYAFTIISYIDALNVGDAASISLGVLFLLYLTSDLGYSTSKTLSDRRFFRKEKTSGRPMQSLIQERSRGGQNVGLRTVLALLFLNVLVMFRVPIPFDIGAGQFVKMNEIVWAGATATVAIIGLFSVLKLVDRKQARYVHNRILLYSTTAATVVYCLWIGVRAFGGDYFIQEIPSYYWLDVYFPILAVYVGHNLFIADYLRAEEKEEQAREEQQNWGHWVGFGALIYGGLIVFLYGFQEIFDANIVKVLPKAEILWFFMGTVFIFVGSISRPDWLAEMRESHDKNKKHKEEGHTAEDPDECEGCK